MVDRLSVPRRIWQTVLRLREENLERGILSNSKTKIILNWKFQKQNGFRRSWIFQKPKPILLFILKEEMV